MQTKNNHKTVETKLVKIKKKNNINHIVISLQYNKI